MSNQLSPIAALLQPPLERHIMRREEVERKTGFKRAHIYNLMKLPMESAGGVANLKRVMKNIGIADLLQAMAA